MNGLLSDPSGYINNAMGFNTSTGQGIGQMTGNTGFGSSWAGAPFQEGVTLDSLNQINQSGAGSAYQPTMMDNLFGWKGTDGTEHGGWGSTALSAGQGLLGAYMGMKQLGMAEDALAENKRQFNINYENQRQSMNTQLEDRQRARVASRGGNGGYESVSNYMDKHGV